MGGAGIFVKLGHPFLGWYMKMGQIRTRDGWGVPKGPKKQDVLYGRSLNDVPVVLLRALKMM